MSDIENMEEFESGEPAPGMEEFVLRTAREIFEEHGEIVRTAIIEHAGEMAPVSLPRVGRGGDVVLLAFKQYIAQTLPTVEGIALVMETWGARLQPGQKRSDLPRNFEDMTPEQGRFEAITVSIEHRAFPERVRLWQAFITRDSENKPTLGPFLKAKGAIGGASIGLLPNWLPPSERAD